MKLLEIFKSWDRRRKYREIVACFKATKEILWDGHPNSLNYNQYICVTIMYTNFSTSTKVKCRDIVEEYLGRDNKLGGYNTAYTWYTRKCGDIVPHSPEMQNVRFKIIDDIIKKYSE